MAETLGSLTDKISIIELKRYYMTRQAERTDVGDEHRHSCLQKLKILTEQRDDLVEEIDKLFIAVMTGKQPLKIYRQYKMYNDPKYRRREM